MSHAVALTVYYRLLNLFLLESSNCIEQVIQDFQFDVTKNITYNIVIKKL